MSERRSSASGRTSLSKQPTLPVSATELQTAFSFFDRHQLGYITADDLKARLAPLYPQLTDKDFSTMTQNKPHFTAADLTALLTTDTTQHSNTADAPHKHTAATASSQSDVMLEAFQLFDPHSRGYVDTEHLTAVLVGLGVSEVTRGDVQLLVEQNDRDKDGKIGLNDFRRMISAHYSSGTSRGASAV